MAINGVWTAEERRRVNKIREMFQKYRRLKRDISDIKLQLDHKELELLRQETQLKLYTEKFAGEIKNARAAKKASAIFI